MQRTSLVRFAPIALASLVLGSSALGCSAESGANDAPSAATVPADFGPDETTFDVTWKPGTKVVDDASAALLEESEADGRFTYRFRPGSAALAALAPGDVAALGGIAYRKIVSVEPRPDGLVVVAERTKLTDAISKGTIAWKRTVDFGDQGATKTASVGLEGGALRPLDVTTGLQWEGKAGDFDVSVSLTPSAGRLDISLAASKSIAGEKRIALTGEGYLERFQSEGRIELDESGLVDFRYGQNQVRGRMKIKAAAFNAGASQDLLNIPLRVQTPVQIGPVPLLLKLGANVNVTAQLQAAPASAEAEVTIEFATDQGVSLAGTSLSAVGGLRSGTLEIEGGGSASHMAAGMSACVEAPRVELGFMGELASVGLTQNNCASTVYTFDPACNQVNASIVGKGLAQLGFFGVTLASADVELYSKRDGRSAGSCR